MRWRGDKIRGDGDGDGEEVSGEISGDRRELKWTEMGEYLKGGHRDKPA